MVPLGTKFYITHVCTQYLCIPLQHQDSVSTKLKSHNGKINTMIGGPQESFKFFVSVLGGVETLLQSFIAGLQRFMDGVMGNPVTFEEIEHANKSNQFVCNRDEVT